MTDWENQYQAVFINTVTLAHYLWCWYYETTESFDEAVCIIPGTNRVCRLPSPKHSDGCATPATDQQWHCISAHAKERLRQLERAALILGLHPRLLCDAKQDVVGWPRSEWQRLHNANTSVNDAIARAA